jgi:two-component system, LytTR family, response regulator
VTRAIIADDEPLAREALRDALEGEAGLEIVAECADGVEALEAAARLSPDLVFLDVRMPGLDGLAVAERLAGGPAVVFVTAFDEHAVRAFDLYAVDYVVKPFEAERVREAVRRARRRLERGEPAAGIAAALEALAARDRYARRLVVGARGALRVVPVEEVDWLEAADNYVQVHAGGAEHLLREPLRSLEARLDPAAFVRVHRSIIVRIDRVAELRPQPTGDYVVALRDGRELPMSRSYRDRVIGRLG